MVRAIRSTAEAIAPTAPEPVEPQPAEGRVFINNVLNREFHYGGGKKFKFAASRERITDPEMIAHLTELANAGTHRIFIEEPEPAPPTQPADEPAATE